MPAKKKKLFSANTIIFDWGNTLILDPFDTILPVVVEKTSIFVKEKFGINLNVHAFSNSWSKSNTELDFPFASHFFQEETFIQNGLKEAKIPVEIRPLLGPIILSEYRKSFKELLEIDTPRNIEVKETLTQLRKMGKHLGVLSNDRHFTPRATLKWLGLNKFFDHFLTSEDMGIAKPDPRVFDVVSERFNTPLTDIIYVGDDPVRDIQCAHAAGVKTILYIPPIKHKIKKSWRFYSVSTTKPDETVNHFSDLLKLIR